MSMSMSMSMSLSMSNKRHNWKLGFQGVKRSRSVDQDVQELVTYLHEGEEMQNKAPSC